MPDALTVLLPMVQLPLVLYLNNSTRGLLPGQTTCGRVLAELCPETALSNIYFNSEYYSTSKVGEDQGRKEREMKGEEERRGRGRERFIPCGNLKLNQSRNFTVAF